jgi:eukaryotic-like serine/threonine-protein kinase
MTLAAGSRLGPYEILAPLGAGGMGEVWRARDSRLDRDVAIKVLPASFASDTERLARFEREAKLLASLNHPHIAAIYGVEEAAGGRALVMELVEGETLAERLTRGPLPLEECLPIARQIATALEAAHERGVVHRDLKPANVKLDRDGQVKVLDFGLAKAVEAEGSQANSPTLMNSPTLTAAGTAMGVILGTAAYMSPEQAKGKAADRRSDIWSFGVLLWECLTGKPLFVGDSVAETIGYVVTRDPDLARLPAGTPRSLRELLSRCLVKDPRRRLQAIGDARVVLDDLSEHPWSELAQPAPTARRVQFVPWVVAALALAALVWTLAARREAPAKREPPAQRVEVTGISIVASSGAAISPDGSEIVAYDMTPSRPRLLRRPVGSFDIQPIPGGEDSFNPFFSPDGKNLGAFAGQRVCVVPLAGGTQRCLARADGFATGSWGPDGTIVFSHSPRDASQGGLFRVPAGGGEAVRLTQVDVAHGEREHQHPQVLPDGRNVLFSIYGQNQLSIAVVPLQGGSPRTLVTGGGRPRYVATGHLLYIDFTHATLHAVRFDPDRLAVAGPPVDLGILPAQVSDLAPYYDVSANGTLLYSENRALSDNFTVERIDHAGRASPLLDEVGSWAQPRISPDGRTLLLRRSAQPDCTLWLFDLERRALSRLEVAGDAHSPLWEWNGGRVVTSVQRLGAQGREVYEQDLAGGELAPLAKVDFAAVAASLTRDGRYLALVHDARRDRNDILVYDRTGAKLTPFAATAFDEDHPAFSPDGHWLAYASNETGRSEVYVRPFPGPGPKYAISNRGGTGPLWARDGRALFYAEGEQLMRVDVGLAPRFAAGPPEKVFGGAEYVWERPGNYDVFPDGQSFVAISRPRGAQAAASLRLVLNWFSDLQRLAPPGGS